MFFFCIFIVHDELKNEVLNEVSQTMKGKFGYLNRSIIDLEGKVVENDKLHGEGIYLLYLDYLIPKLVTEHVHLLVFKKKLCLCGLIRYCSFINFREKINPVRVFDFLLFE